MRVGALLDAAAAQALAFDWLTGVLRPLSEYGRRTFAELRPFVPGEERAALARARAIAERAMVDADRLNALAAVFAAVPDVMSAIARASMGDVLDDAAFLELQRFCDAAERIDALRGDSFAAPLCNAGVHTVTNALERGRTRGSGFYLAEAFDAALASARAEYASEQAAFEAVRGRALADIARWLGRDDVSGDEFIVMRADVGELPPGLRVLREAPTYWLCVAELDDASLTALQRRDAAAAAVAAVEEQVRTELSRAIGASAPDLQAAAAALGELDVIVAAAGFARDHGCRVANISSEPVLEFEDGRFPPLALELARDGRAFTPITVELRGTSVLTGPNMGGKSVCLRTSGLIAVCAAFGLPVPAERATCALFEEIAWLGVGAGDDRHPGGLLSTFAREVVHVRDTLTRARGRLLVLADEFARTTTPLEGKALLVALLQHLRERDACVLAATHLAGVAEAAGAHHFAVRGLRGIPQPPPAGDLHQALAALAASMDYTIAEVGSDAISSADALALASLLGLEAGIVDDARRILDSGGE